MKDERLYVVQILECAKRIAQYTAEGKQAFMQDLKTQDAVIRHVEIAPERSSRTYEHR